VTVEVRRQLNKLSLTIDSVNAVNEVT
jgi:hypothetical protein